MEKHGNISETAALRRKAEELLKMKSSKTVSQLSEVEYHKLINELQVHQIELELQNEELRHAWAEAEVANEKYIGLYDLAPSGYFTLSVKGEIIELNLSGANMLGKNRQHLKNSLFVFCVSEEIKSIFRLFLEKVFQTKRKETCEVKLATKDDRPSYVLLTAIITENQEQCHVTAVDITERKQAEEALKESKEILSLFIRHSPLFTYIKEVTPNESRVLQASENLTQMIGIPWEKVIGRSMEELFPNEFARQMTADDLAVISSGNLLQKDEDFNGRNFTTIKFPLLQGDKSLLAGFTIDITDRKLAEEALRESEEYFRLLFENNSTAMALIEPDTTISMVNEEYCKLCGYTKLEVVGMSWTQQIPPQDPERLKEYNRRRMINPKDAPDKYEFTFCRKSGEIRHSMMSITMLSNRKIIASFVDITERLQEEQEIKQKNEELAKLNAEKDKFFSIIAHDLRGPFNGFLGLSKMMAEDLPALTLEQVQKMASGMRDSATNLFRLLENLLEWSRLQRDITPFEPESFLLMCMMTESMRPVMDSANKKEIEISYEIPADLEVFADKYMLASIIRNLASNAVKFTLKGGKVTIAAKPGPGHSVEISVRDTGIGMSAQMVAGLFRIDVKSNRKGTENEPSSGLGLLLCKDFVEKHGGKIWVESEEGRGSTFCLTLPGN